MNQGYLKCTKNRNLKQIVFFILCLAPLITHAQFKLGGDLLKKETVGFSSGFAGTPTKVVDKFSNLLKEDKISIIQDNLGSMQAGDQFLAAYILIKLDAMGDIKLDKEIKDKISSLKKSNLKVPINSGCNYFEEIALKDLLNPKNPINESAELWFESIYKS